MLINFRYGSSSCFWNLLMLMMLVSLNTNSASPTGEQNKHRAARQTLFFNIGVTPDPNSCDTPDGTPGSCVNLIDCKVLYSKLRSSPTPDFINFLRR
ncbi:hypothetical protein SK128_023142 [Halocaridina rubra]|uniref:Clip domain-containing protein n=1 Tax=Halocaridina rubra TaxID=373956 RepID=A0AAN8XDY2_HALRR